MDDFAASLPRSSDLEGAGLAIAEVRMDGSVVITDGTRSAAYRPHDAAPLAGPDLRIVPRYVEAGRFREAHAVTITDGELTAVYVPVGAP